MNYNDEKVYYVDNVAVNASDFGVIITFRQGGNTVREVGMSVKMAKTLLRVLRGRLGVAGKCVICGCQSKEEICKRHKRDYKGKKSKNVMKKKDDND